MEIPPFDLQKLQDATPDPQEKELLKAFPDVVSILKASIASVDNDLEDGIVHFGKVLEYNVPNGQKTRGLMLIYSYLEMASDFTDEDLKIARYIAWALELHQASFQMCDEITFERNVNLDGNPCWHKTVGTEKDLETTNDMYYLECALYVLLQEINLERDRLRRVVTLFLKAARYNVKGQNIFLNTIHAPGESVVAKFTRESYNMYVKYRISGYSFLLPLSIALELADKATDESYKQLKQASIALGRYFQAKDDFLKCFDEKGVFKNCVNDIEHGRISWPIITALEMATASQREILETNYGQSDKACIEKVKAVYRDLDIEGEFRKYEAKVFQDTVDQLSGMTGNVPKVFLLDLTHKIRNWNDSMRFF